MNSKEYKEIITKWIKEFNRDAEIIISQDGKKNYSLTIDGINAIISYMPIKELYYFIYGVLQSRNTISKLENYKTLE